MKQVFEARLIAHGPDGAWTSLEIPFKAEEAFGRRSRVPVAGTINGFPFRSSLMPVGDGTHMMAVNKEMKAGAKASAGDLVSVIMDIDLAERIVIVPEELKQALETDAPAAEFFETLSYSHKKEFADWVGGAKRAETRIDRARKSLEMIVARKHVG